jgi:hypothetical protein
VADAGPSPVLGVVTDNRLKKWKAEHRVTG